MKPRRSAADSAKASHTTRQPKASPRPGRSDGPSTSRGPRAQAGRGPRTQATREARPPAARESRPQASRDRGPQAGREPRAQATRESRPQAGREPRAQATRESRPQAGREPRVQATRESRPPATRDPRPQATREPRDPFPRRPLPSGKGDPRPQAHPAPTLSSPPPAEPIRSFAEERVWGRRTVLEHMRSGTPINRIHVLANAQGLHREFFELADERGIPVIRCQRDRLDFLASGGNHQGVLAQLGARAFATASEVVEAFLAQEASGLLLVLSGVQDPGNLGAILRTAEGAGVQGILLSARDSCGLTPTVSKVSAGADAHVRVARAERLDKVLDPLKQQGIQIVTTVPGAPTPYFSINFLRPTVIVLGGEGDGLDGRLIRQATHRVGIPMLGKIESLNVSAATAVLLYEAIRQRSSAP